MKKRIVTEECKFEINTSISILAKISGVKYNILDILPENKLRVEFIVKGPITHNLQIISPFSCEYVFASYDEGPIKMINRNKLEECKIEDLERLFQNEK